MWSLVLESWRIQEQEGTEVWWLADVEVELQGCVGLSGRGNCISPHVPLKPQMFFTAVTVLADLISYASPVKLFHSQKAR